MAVFATVLALAACGADIPDDPSLTVGPTLPTGGTDPDTAERDDESDPTATPPAASGPSATPAVATPPVEAPATDAAAPEEPGTETPAVGTGGGETQPSTEPAATSTLPDFVPPGEAVAREAAGQPQVLVEGVRVGVHEGYDRVVLDLSGTGEVGWTAQFVTDAALDGSGAPVDLAGEFLLRVDLQGMAYPEPGDTAYEDRVLLVDGGDLSTVTEVLRATPFEGQVSVFIGTRTEAPFRVFALSDPERLVIDVQQ